MKKAKKIKGKIRSITDFGVFIGLDGNIDGLVHLSDISWNMPGEEAVKEYKKGQDLEAVVLSVDPERERISLGIKQLESDPFGQYLAENTKGSIVTGKVLEVDAKGAAIELAPEVIAYMKASEIQSDKVNDAQEHLSVGQEVEAKITNIDRKTRQIHLSVKAKDLQEEAETVRGYSRNADGAVNATLGDLLKKQLNQDQD
jgi:small subunit ribosomal protein S1